MVRRIVVFGATGHVGRLAVESLLRRGLRPVIAGRRSLELRSMAREFGGLEHAYADVIDPDSVRALVRSGDVFVSTLGRFDHARRVVADLVATAGAHYVDGSGDMAFVHALRATVHERAIESGSTMLPGIGHDFVPGILAGAIAAQRGADRARTLRIGYFSTGPMQHGRRRGTSAAVADGLMAASTAILEGRAVDANEPRRVRTFDVRGRPRTGLLVEATESASLGDRVDPLRTIEVFDGCLPTFGAASDVPRNVHGHGAARTVTNVVGIAFDEAGVPVSEVHLEGPGAYDFTSDLVAVAAGWLAEGRGRSAGVVGPLDAFGLHGTMAACEAIGLRFVPG